MKKYFGLPFMSIFIFSLILGFSPSKSVAMGVNESQSINVQYKTQGNNVLVECILTGISFRESNTERKKVGKLVVWLDGKRKQEATSAAFIIKGVPEGNHKIKLEVVNLNNVPYGLTKEFLVNIPK